MGKKSCLIICPIGEAGDIYRTHSDEVYKYILMPALGEEYDLQRADMMMETGKITNQIFEGLLEADLVVADLSYFNPNVFYELTIRHITCKPCIHMLSPIDVKIPFDINTMRTILFNRDLAGADKAIQDLKKQVSSISRIKPDNPIVESITHGAIKKALEDIKNVKFSGDTSKAISESMISMIDGLAEVKSELRKLNEQKSGYAGLSQGMVFRGVEVGKIGPSQYFGVTPDKDERPGWTTIKVDGPLVLEGKPISSGSDFMSNSVKLGGYSDFKSEKNIESNTPQKKKEIKKE